MEGKGRSGVVGTVSSAYGESREISHESPFLS